MTHAHTKQPQQPTSNPANPADQPTSQQTNQPKTQTTQASRQTNKRTNKHTHTHRDIHTQTHIHTYILTYIHTCKEAHYKEAQPTNIQVCVCVCKHTLYYELAAGLCTHKCLHLCMQVSVCTQTCHQKMNMLPVTASLHHAAWKHSLASPSRCPREGSTLALCGLPQATSSHTAVGGFARRSDLFRIEKQCNYSLIACCGMGGFGVIRVNPDRQVADAGAQGKRQLHCSGKGLVRPTSVDTIPKS